MPKTVLQTLTRDKPIRREFQKWTGRMEWINTSVESVKVEKQCHFITKEKGQLYSTFPIHTRHAHLTIWTAILLEDSTRRCDFNPTAAPTNVNLSTSAATSSVRKAR